MTLLGYSQISQHLPPPKTETQALPESQVASEVHVSRQLVVSAQTGAPDTSDTHRVRRPPQSDAPHVDPCGEQGIKRLPISAMTT